MPESVLATTSYALALADVGWNESAVLQGVYEEVAAALDLALNTLGPEHPGSVILATHRCKYCRNACIQGALSGTRGRRLIDDYYHPRRDAYGWLRPWRIRQLAESRKLDPQRKAPTVPEIEIVPNVAVNDIGSEEAFLAIDETIKYFNDGNIVEGTVVKVDRDEVLLDIGYKTEGVIPSRELSIKHDVDPHDVVHTGEHIEALVLQKEDKEGRLILSKKRAQYERAWGTIEKIKEVDGVVTGTVIEVVKGGLILDIGLRGFLPASLVEMRRVRDLQPYVGQTIEAKIIELDKNRNNVVLSRRAWLEQTQFEVRHTFLNTLSKGQIRRGMVSSIVDFGAFVDLGGVDGLVHVSELSWKHIDHPGEVVEVGQEVTVEVLDVDMDRERVSLSLKSTQEDPWQQFARTHQIGQVVPGRVTKLVPFGAFVRVEEGIEGLVHISELADRHVEIPEQVVQVGDEIFVKIIDIDLDRRRISLSLKQANEGTIGETVGDDFDPTLYGMPASYEEQGNYEYPDGSTRGPASGCPATRSSARSGSTSTPRRAPGSRRTGVRWRNPARPTRRKQPQRETPTPKARLWAAPARGGRGRGASQQGGHGRCGHVQLQPRRGRRHRHPGLRRGPGRLPRAALRWPELKADLRTGVTSKSACASGVHWWRSTVSGQTIDHVAILASS